MLYPATGLASLISLLFVVSFAIEVSADDEPSQSGKTVGALLDLKSDVVFPPCKSIINIKKPPYNAKGDGKTDDTTAIQKALSDMMGQHQMLYFPAGDYIVSSTLQWSNKNSSGANAWGFNWLQGQGPAKTRIRLKDGVFQDAKNPQSMMWCGGFGSADWFHNHVEGITFDIGSDNPGAIGLQFYTNNYGAVRQCRFIDRSGIGLIGLDLGHRDMNGPLLIKDCEIVGFQRGVSTAGGVNGQTIERITLRGQKEVGIVNQGQSLSIRSLLSKNEVPAITSYGTLAVIDADLQGKAGASNHPAILNFNGGRIYVRDVDTSGYKRALADLVTPDSAAAYRLTADEQPKSVGPKLDEYFSHAITNPFGGKTESIRLEVADEPTIPADKPSAWANVDRFGADPTGGKDSSAAIQKAIDSGASTIFFPGSYKLESTVIVRNNVHRMLSVGGGVDYFSQSTPDFRVADGDGTPIVFEHFFSINGGIEVDSARTVMIKSAGVRHLTFTNRAKGGHLFIEDVTTDDLKLNEQKLWARQLNIENEGTHLTNRASDVWVLGYKTERGGTLVETKERGRSEILGGFSYTTTAGKLAPMFVTTDSSVFAYFGEVCYTGDPFQTIVNETRGGSTKTILRGGGETVPYISVHD